MVRKEDTVRTAVVVEDDADQRSLVTALLEESEFSIVECESGEAALATMRMRGDVALVFSDLRLAGLMDGVELAREVKKHWPQLTMVLSPEHVDCRVESLPDDIFVLPKPWLALDVLKIAERARAAGGNHSRA
jgi:DNA-binding NtrC family response regulator